MATAAATNPKQLQENLSNSEAQLHQVEAALTNDPENEELLKLKTDLLLFIAFVLCDKKLFRGLGTREVIHLTKDLLQLAPEPKKKEKSLLAYDWKSGDPCRAIWADNAKYYNAVIDMLSEDGETCTVTFDGYGTTVIVKVRDLKPQGWDEDEGGEGRKRLRKSLQGGTVPKKVREEIKDYKKKKAQKKLTRLQEVSEFREHEKQRWKHFTQKSSRQRGGPINSKQKRSIFAVPESLQGKVGVGTCNVGGKPMTDFSTPKNYVRP